MKTAPLASVILAAAAIEIVHLDVEPLSDLPVAVVVDYVGDGFYV